MRREDREAILWEGVTRVEHPVDRRARAEVEVDLSTSPLHGKRLPLRIRNFRPSLESYLTALGGPLPYMVRLKEIDEETFRQQGLLEAAWLDEAATADSGETFATRWLERAGSWVLDEVNDLIDRHNRWYPVEAGLPMDPRTGDFALVFGRDYRRPRLDARWILEQFPPDRARARAFRQRSTSAAAGLPAA